MKNSSKWSLGSVYLTEKWQAVNWWWDCTDLSILGELTKKKNFLTWYFRELTKKDFFLVFSLSPFFLSSLLLHSLFASNRSCCALSNSCIYFLPSWTQLTAAASVAPIIKIRRITQLNSSIIIEQINIKINHLRLKIFQGIYLSPPFCTLKFLLSLLLFGTKKLL